MREWQIPVGISRVCIHISSSGLNPDSNLGSVSESNIPTEVQIVSLMGNVWDEHTYDCFEAHCSKISLRGLEVFGWRPGIAIDS